MARVSDLLATLEKSGNGNLAKFGQIQIQSSRIGTGVLEFDLATGGGFPEGRISIVYGPESSLKTTISLLAIASHQRKYPESVSAFIDVEGSYDAEYAANLGVDPERVVHVVPDYGEQVVDLCEKLLEAEDIGVIVLDSLAAMVPLKESEDGADKAQVGTQGLLIGKLYRKVTLGLNKARKEGRAPLFIAINQIRMKIGVMYGNPETMPGGVAFKFASSLTVRLYGKDEMDKAVHPALPAYKVVTGQIQKTKVKTLAKAFEFRFPLVTNEDAGVFFGKPDSWPLLKRYLTELGHLGKIEGKNTWQLFCEEFPTQKAIRQHLAASPDDYDAVVSALLKELGCE
jgi:recombination protein RecA